MIEIILLSLFGIGVAGAGTILFRRMPFAQRTAAIPGSAEAVNLGQAAKNLCVAGIKKVPCFRDFNWLDFVQKMLMRGRVLVLKAENKINEYMTKLRQKAEAEREKDGEVLDNYWHDLKSMVKTKNPMRRSAAADGEDALPESEGRPEEVDVHAAITQAQAQIETVQLSVTKVALPEEPQKAQTQNQSQTQKKKRGTKKRKFKDPFQW